MVGPESSGPTRMDGWLMSAPKLRGVRAVAPSLRKASGRRALQVHLLVGLSFLVGGPAVSRAASSCVLALVPSGQIMLDLLVLSLTFIERGAHQFRSSFSFLLPVAIKRK